MDAQGQLLVVGTADRNIQARRRPLPAACGLLHAATWERAGVVHALDTRGQLLAGSWRGGPRYIQEAHACWPWRRGQCCPWVCLMTVTAQYAKIHLDCSLRRCGSLHDAR